MNERYRLFFALWPAAALRARLSGLVSRQTHLRGKAVAPENLHMTLVFLGSVDADQKACAARVAGEIRAASFSLILDECGYWRRPRVLWVGASRIPEPLQALAKQLNRRLEACGHRPEKRDFHAHVTLLRRAVRVPPNLLGEPLHWLVQDFSLVQSETLAEGVRYRVLQSWPLLGDRA